MEQQEFKLYQASPLSVVSFGTAKKDIYCFSTEEFSKMFICEVQRHVNRPALLVRTPEKSKEVMKKTKTRKI